MIKSLVNSGELLGLEAGSKSELMAVLAHLGMAPSMIVCNCYKDREYIRLALIAQKLGHKVYLVIEKMSEINMVLEKAERMGVRARLVSKGSGKWQSSGGAGCRAGTDVGRDPARSGPPRQLVTAALSPGFAIDQHSRYHYRRA